MFLKTKELDGSDKSSLSESLLLPSAVNIRQLSSAVLNTSLLWVARVMLSVFLTVIFKAPKYGKSPLTLPCTFVTKHFSIIIYFNCYTIVSYSYNHIINYQYAFHVNLNDNQLGVMKYIYVQYLLQIYQINHHYKFPQFCQNLQ